MTQASRQNFSVLINGSVVGTFTPAGTSYQAYTTAPFNVGTPGPVTITFKGLDSAGGDNTAFIDEVSCTQITTPTIADPGFEQEQVGAGIFLYGPTGSAWNFSGGSGIASNNSQITSGNSPAPQGSQVAFLPGTGAITQTIAGWIAGTYEVTFEAAQCVNQQAVPAELQRADQRQRRGHFHAFWFVLPELSTAPFTLTYAGPVTISFEGLDTAGGNNSALLDQVTLAQVATPSIGDPGFEQVQVGAG